MDQELRKLLRAINSGALDIRDVITQLQPHLSHQALEQLFLQIGYELQERDPENRDQVINQPISVNDKLLDVWLLVINDDRNSENVYEICSLCPLTAWESVAREVIDNSDTYFRFHDNEDGRFVFLNHLLEVLKIPEASQRLVALKDIFRVSAPTCASPDSPDCHDDSCQVHYGSLHPDSPAPVYGVGTHFTIILDLISLDPAVSA